MNRSSNNLLGHRQPPPSVDNYRAHNELVMKPTSARTSHHSPIRQNDDEWDNNHRFSRKLDVDHSSNPARSRSSSAVSLKSMVIEGQWKYRGHDDDRLRLVSMGIENLVDICHDIMNKTFESTNRKEHKRSKSPSTHNSWPAVKLDAFKKLTDTDRASLHRARLLGLMTIVYEATTTDASISQLVRIWREAAEHNLRPRRPTASNNRPIISYENAFRHLIRTPDDQLLQIALHASLISTHNNADLQRLGEKLGVKRSHFDMNSIRDSTKAFRILIKLLHEQRLKQKREQHHIDTNRLPYKPKRKRGLHVNISGTKFRLVHQAVDVYGFSIVSDCDFTSNLLWSDTLISRDIVSALKPYQKVNHFLAMNEISRKDLFAKNYDRLSHLLPRVYNFAPQTWILPNDYNLWYSYASKKPKKEPAAYIVKPIDGAIGHGIEIHCDYKQIHHMNHYIIQEYIREPYLIDGFKFDLRIYALITSCDPLRVFIYNNGIVCLSTKKYAIPHEKNIYNHHMHLTNHLMDDDDFDSDNSRKHSLKYLFDYLKKHHQNVDVLWEEIQNIVIKTIFLAEPHVLNTYRDCRPGALPSSESVCFELLSFDILIDKHLKPWITEVNHCPSFDMHEQIDFDIKLKLLLDTFDLLRFRVSDRKKSVHIEKIETQHRLFLNLGRSTHDQTPENKLAELKETLYLLRREKARETFEIHHLGGFIPLFPTDDRNRMDELIHIVTKCFQVLCTNEHDLLRDSKHHHQHNKEKLTHQYNEEELISQITHLEHIHHTNLHEHPRLTHVSASSSTCFTFESSDDDERTRSKSPHHHTIKRPTSSTHDSFMKKVSTQTPSDILRSTSSSSLNITKQRSKSPMSSGTVSRPEADSKHILPGVSARRITKKTAYSTPPSHHHHIDERPRSSSPKHRHSNDKSQMVTYSSIVQATRKQQTTDRSIPTDITKKLRLTDDDLNHLYHLIFEQMYELCIHYPNKSDKETYHICNEIIEHWNHYKSDIGRFWFVELDTDKKESVIEIVWNNVQQIIKKLCIVDELVHELPLNRHLKKLEKRLLANKGQCLWDACQNRHSSWESLFVKSTNYLSTIELDCCYRFVELCKEALFIVYRYSIEEKIHKQRHMHQHLTMTVKN